VAVERRLARELALEVGDTIRLGPAPDSMRTLATVGAIYEPRADPAEVTRQERHVRLHLPDLAALLGTPDRVDRFGIGLTPGAPVDTVIAALDRTAFGYQAFSSSAIAAQSSQTFLVVSRFHRAIAVITIVASAVFLLCIMLLKVEERRMDAAVMRFIGVRRRTMFGALVLEAALVAVVGSVLGTGLALGAGAATNAYYQRFFDTTLTFSLITPGIVLLSVALSLVLGLAAGAAAAWRLVRTRPMVLWSRG
jgi:putative ABC transport system permease protein